MVRINCENPHKDVVKDMTKMGDLAYFIFKQLLHQRLQVFFFLELQLAKCSLMGFIYQSISIGENMIASKLPIYAHMIVGLLNLVINLYSK